MYLQTDRLILRPLRMTDVEQVFLYRSDPEVIRYQSFDTFTRENAKAFVQGQAGLILHRAGEWVQIGFADKSTDLLVGDCAVKLLAAEPKIAEIGYTIARSHQRKGLGKEGVRGLLQLLFEQKQLHKVQALIDIRNEASIALVKALGFQQEAHFRQSWWEEGQWWDEVQYGLLKEEWEMSKE